MKYFRMSEFECPCCGMVMMNTGFLAKLEKAHALSRVPFEIVTGFRCMKYGSAADNPYITGYAACIAADTEIKRFEILKALLDSGIKRIGIKETSVHADDIPKLKKRVAWL